MKKIFTIIVVILLFIVSGLIFWAGLSPNTFSKFFAKYPVVNKTVNQISVINQTNTSFKVLSSEPVSNSVGQVIIGENVWSVEIASNEQDRTLGLSGRKALFNKRGMLFVFDKLEAHSFWMKDMLLPLDIIFFDNNWKIVLIENNLQSNSFPKTFGDKVKSQYILEINASEALTYGLKVDDQAVFLNK
ncbi:MAG: hypothetical protein A2541_00865 [Candidatus Taylorbacteria bacterium RIFOXYD2_FULL_36_9]|uniref:DUF192 domain-containing protein n=1 Tax=Candidatus Taylorbacteria bacterium RIFOXYD2_FULL_36_9 TaxID=1802338 RepID=A0A1G2PIF9_9BACT|nr:MAG: hypothetical protein A2541_00865 [Candidatus Taylorbacteria bacterium RIFOXYD2_FULL_36_9]